MKHFHPSLFPLLSGLSLLSIAVGCTPVPPAATESVSTSTPTISTPTTPTETLVETPAIGYQSQTACDLPYNPRRPGPIEQNEPSGTVVIGNLEITGDTTHATMVMTRDLGETGHLETIFECDSNGIKEIGYTNFGFSGEGNQTPRKISLVSSTGYTWPPADQWVVGYTWDFCLEFRIDEGEGYTEYKGNTSRCVKNTISAMEPVEYQGVTIDALRLDTVTHLEPPEPYDTVAMTCWHAVGIGLINCE